MATRYHPYRRSASSSSSSSTPRSSPRQSPRDQKYNSALTAKSSDPAGNAVVTSLRAEEAAKVKEPDWNDFDAARYWLEQRYRPGDAELGSPLFQYITKLQMKLQRNRKIPNPWLGPYYLGTMLSDRELDRFIHEYPKAKYVHFPNQKPMYQDPPLTPTLTWCDPSCSFIDLDTAKLIKEPNWKDDEASRAWLEQRYCPDGAHLGSPLFRYMTDCFCGVQPSYFTPSLWLGELLSWEELKRWNYGESGSKRTWVLDKAKEPLYPDPPLSDGPRNTRHTHWLQLNWADRSSPFQDLGSAGLMVEPRWRDKEASKAWLEQRYDAGDGSAGSPLLQYMMDLYNGPHFQHIPPSGHYSYMLSFDEMGRFSGEFGHAMHWDENMKPLYPDGSSPFSHEAIPVVRNGSNGRKPNQTPKRPKRTNAEKRQDQEASVGKLRSGIAKRKHKKPGV